MRARTTLLTLLAFLAIADAAHAATAPAIEGGRAVAGRPEVGSRLEGTARWTGSKPLEVRWTWLRCAGTSETGCKPIKGADRRTYAVRPADQGSLLRARVRVENEHGWAWVLSAPTDAVRPAPDPPAPEEGGVLGEEAESAPRLDPFPVVRIRGRLTRTGARVSRLTVTAPEGARIVVRCKGRGCPRSRWAGTASLVRVAPFERILRSGVRLTITVTRPGYVGKHTVIALRRGKPPARRDRCLYPGESQPRRCGAV
jgi:hypothetical protein